MRYVCIVQTCMLVVFYSLYSLENLSLGNLRPMVPQSPPPEYASHTSSPPAYDFNQTTQPLDLNNLTVRQRAAQELWYMLPNYSDIFPDRNGLCNGSGVFTTVAYSISTFCSLSLCAGGVFLFAYLGDQQDTSTYALNGGLVAGGALGLSASVSCMIRECRERRRLRMDAS